MNQNDRFNYLLSQYLSGKVSTQEHDEFFELVNTHEYDSLLGSSILNDLNNSNQTYTADLPPHIAQEIIRNIYQAEKNAAKIIPMQKQTKTAWRWIAAASVILLLGSVAMILQRNSTSKNTIAKKENLLKNDVAPGQQGAVLTLANGEIVLLDSAGNGTVATQGNAQVFKKDGKLIYSNTGNSAEVVYNTIATPKGRQYKLELSDGSMVWLNASSSITYPSVFTGKERRVKVTGEAYFEIAHNSKMPFVAEKGSVSVLVLGTHFNFNSYEDETSVNVTLLEGTVNVRDGMDNALIKPGQQAQVKANNKIRLISNVDVEQVVAWKNGLFHFEKSDIQIVMRQLARWYDVEVVYNKPPRENDPLFVEISRNTNLSDVLKALEISGSARFKIDGKKIIVF